ncbi:hypothetical protein FGO68_gene2416 [Halteria grandinella]|uniref:Uncharacterized protein n=1 Tax=Halteria grandinella TaxID=5974 RepID=A0A8J8SW71_HALGN|nr:hypothetical protein FGO68_gene2416 [Halteria grandinella]
MCCQFRQETQLLVLGCEDTIHVEEALIFLILRKQTFKLIYIERGIVEIFCLLKLCPFIVSAFCIRLNYWLQPHYFLTYQLLLACISLRMTWFREYLTEAYGIFIILNGFSL